MDMDLCRHLLLNNGNEENEPQAGSDAPAPLRREFQQALRNTLLSPSFGGGGGSGGSSKVERSGGAGAGLGSGVAPRVLSFSERPPAPQEQYTNVVKVRGYVHLSVAAWIAVVKVGALLCTVARSCYLILTRVCNKRRKCVIRLLANRLLCVLVRKSKLSCYS